MNQPKSRIFADVHEAATDLCEAGLITKRRMQEFDALCRMSVHEMPAQQIGERVRQPAIPVPYNETLHR